jgi:hypothetical protein
VPPFQRARSLADRTDTTESNAEPMNGLEAEHRSIPT